MNRIKKFGEKIWNIGLVFQSHHIGAYAAQAAFFFVLSMLPICWLLMTLVRVTPITMQEIMEAILPLFPDSVKDFVNSIIWQVFTQSFTLIPVTVLVALWSAGRGVLAVSSGLNVIYESVETRNYIYLRIRSSFYTVLFLFAILFSLLLSVFGNRISLLIYEYVPFLSPVITFIIQTRTVVTLGVLTIFWIFVYRYLPNRKNKKNLTFRRQLPGAIFTACGWLLISFVFSIYLDIFTGFSNMYGSLTTIVLIMLWLYMCMYAVLIGGEVNAAIEKRVQNL